MYFLAAILFCIFLNIPYLNAVIVPRADTLRVFDIFYFFYNDFFYHNTFPQWNPYYLHGITSYLFQIETLTPANYFLMMVGKLFHIQNVLLLYKLSVLLEQIMFVTGIFFLSRLLFSNRITSLFVSVCASGSIIWYSQIYFNFRLYYLTPFILFFLILFYIKKQPRYFWLACLWQLAQVIGNPPYFPCLYFFTFLLMNVLLAFNYKDAVRTFLDSKHWKSPLWILFLVLTILYAWFMFSIKKDYGMDIWQRDPVSGAVTLDSFQRHAGNPNLDELLHSLFFANPMTLKVGNWDDNSVYFGLLPILLLCYAIRYARSKLFNVMLIIAAVLLTFTLGGVLSTFIYHVPLMAYFRHVGLLCSLLKIFLILIAGYGFDTFCSSTNKKQLMGLMVMAVIILFLPDLFYPDHQKALQDNLSKFNLFSSEGLHFISTHGYFIAAALLVIMGACFLKRGRMIAVYVILSLTVLDVMIFQNNVFQKLFRIPKDREFLVESFNTRQTPYQTQRGLLPDDPKQKQAYELLFSPLARIVYPDVFAVIQYDHCSPNTSLEVFNQGYYWLKGVNKNLPALLGGCLYPKIRYYQDVIGYGSNDQAEELIKGLNSRLTNTLLIASAKDAFPSVQTGNAFSSDAIQTKVTAYQPDTITIQTVVTQPKGVFLSYFDGYHPAWKAKVNGVKTKIYEAYGAYKAIFIPQGKNVIQIYFDNGVVSVIFFAIIFFSVLFVVHWMFEVISALKRPE